MATPSDTRVSSQDCILAQTGNPPLDQIIALFTGTSETVTRRIRDRLLANIERESDMLDTQAEKIEEGAEDRDAREHGQLIVQHTAGMRNVVDMFNSLLLMKEIAQAGIRRMGGEDVSELRSANKRRLKPPVIREAEIS